MNFFDPGRLVDPSYYLLKNPDVAAAGVDPVHHYLVHGDFEGRRPNAAFHTVWYRQTYNIDSSESAIEHYISAGPVSKLRPNSLFDPDFYRETNKVPEDQYPLQHYVSSKNRLSLPVCDFFDANTYLTFNPDLHGVDLVEHFVDHGHAEKRIFSDRYTLEPISAARTERERVILIGGYRYAVREKPTAEHVAPQFLRAAEIEADLVAPFRNRQFLDRVRVSPDTSERVALARLIGGLETPIQRVILLPWLVRGGADLVATNVYKWIRGFADPDGSATLILITRERSVEAIDWLPKDALIRFLPEIIPNATPEYSAEVLAKLIVAIQPRDIININSEVGWFMYQDFGKQLSQFTSLYAFLFCFDYNEANEPVGYARDFLRQTMGVIKRVYTDNNAFIDQACRMFHFGPSARAKFTTVYNPVPFTTSRNRALRSEEIAERIRAKHGNATLLWAGRFSKQKRVDILVDVASKLPHVRFIVGGYSYDDLDGLVDQLSFLPNVEMWGEYRKFSDLPVEQCDGFLYTSGWDGIPNILLEAAAAGLPIIASNVGGVSELLGEGRGMLVDNYSADFIKAINRFCREPTVAIDMVRSTQNYIDSVHSKQAAIATVRASIGFLE